MSEQEPVPVPEPEPERDLYKKLERNLIKQFHTQNNCHLAILTFERLFYKRNDGKIKNSDPLCYS